MRMPSSFLCTRRWLEMTGETESSLAGSPYAPAHPEPFVPGVGVLSISRRLRLARLVFTGKADALGWVNQ